MDYTIENYIIGQPYSRTDQDDDDIRHASPEGNIHTDWEKTCLKNYKENLRNFLSDPQENRCAYCRMEIHENEASEELEHIVPKQKHPEWMYEPLNICLSCKLCNTKKGHTTPVLRDEHAKALPTCSEGYLLINPYFDKYYDHIELVDDILYKGKTPKGEYTIKLCDLSRYDLAAARAKKVILEEGGNGFTKVLLLMDYSNHFEKLGVDRDKFKETLGQICDEIRKYKKNNM